MSEKRYIVPPGMLRAVEAAFGYHPDRGPVYHNGVSLRDALGAAVGWMSENPIVPTKEGERDLYQRWKEAAPNDCFVIWAIRDWQRRMFLAPEPKVQGLFPLNPKKCPHRWTVADDPSTMEPVVLCELCGWVYSLTAVEPAKE